MLVLMQYQKVIPQTVVKGNSPKRRHDAFRTSYYKSCVSRTSVDLRRPPFSECKEKVHESSVSRKGPGKGDPMPAMVESPVDSAMVGSPGPLLISE